MPFPLMAGMALGGALGGLGGKQRAKAANQPTVTNFTRRLTPPSQLGGWDRLNEVMNRVRDLPMYRPGMNNPYLRQTFSHILGRAGVQAPQGGWQMPQNNPYLGGG